ncbi:MAG TPA: hypothetical protein VL689_05255 [Paraburkholderia sp.]|jgi:hypothetical protein|nr:hypothetical protein [Paraburkholderia sp.]
MISTSRSPARPPRARHAKRLSWFRGPTFARDITLILVIKLSLLLALKYAFFNHPPAQNMSMPTAEVAQAILSVPAANVPKVPSVAQGERHAH